MAIPPLREPRTPRPEVSPSGIHPNLRPAPESLKEIPFPPHVVGDAPDRRHWLAAIQAKVLAGMGQKLRFKSLMACMAAPVPASGVRKDGSFYTTKSPGRVQLHAYRSDDGAAGGAAPYGFAWLKRCASPMLCFTCAPKIRFRRAQEVRQAVEWAIGAGMSAMMITFTAPHYADTDPRRQVEAFNAAKRRFKSGRWWQEQRARIGYRHSIRALEVTMLHPQHGIGNGAHAHDHGLYLCDHEAFTPEEAEKLRAEWLDRWRACLEAEGVEIRDMKYFALHGIDIKLPEARGKVVDDAALTAMAEYVADRMGAEISPGIFAKTGKRKEEGEKDGDEKDKHINHFEYMALALTRYPAERGYMVKLMTALKGRAWMQWTRGLKAAAGIEEKTDAELLEEKKGEVVREYNTKTEWVPINRRKLQRRYIRAIVAEQQSRGEDVDLESLVSLADDMVKIILAGFDPLTGERFEDPPD